MQLYGHSGTWRQPTRDLGPDRRSRAYSKLDGREGVLVTSLPRCGSARRDRRIPSACASHHVIGFVESSLSPDRLGTMPLAECVTLGVVQGPQRALNLAFRCPGFSLPLCPK
jgi:hypothetical protein